MMEQLNNDKLFLINLKDLLKNNKNYVGNITKIESDILRLSKSKIHSKTPFNPFPNHPKVKKFDIPFFKIPDLLLAIDGLMRRFDDKNDAILLNDYKQNLMNLYKKITDSNPNNTREISLIKFFRDVCFPRIFDTNDIDKAELQALNDIIYANERERNRILEKIYFFNIDDVPKRVCEILCLLLNGGDRTIFKKFDNPQKSSTEDPILKSEEENKNTNQKNSFKSKKNNKQLNNTIETYE